MVPSEKWQELEGTEYSWSPRPLKLERGRSKRRGLTGTCSVSGGILGINLHPSECFVANNNNNKKMPGIYTAQGYLYPRSKVMHLCTCLTTYIWSRKGLDVTCARLPTDRVLFHAHTTHSVTKVSLSRGLVSGIAFQDTYATKISPTAASGVISRHMGFPATGAQCDILLNCAL